MSSPTQTAPGRTAFDPTRTEAELSGRCDALVEKARAAGAEEAEAFAAARSSVSVRYEKGDLKLVHVDEGTSIGLRLFRDQQIGFSSTNQTDDEALARTAADAAELARLSPPDDKNRLPDPRPGVDRPSLVHAEVADVPVEDVVQRAADFVARVKAADPRLSIDQVEVDSTRGTHAVGTHAGVRAAESDAVLSVSVFGMAIDGDDVGGFHYTGDVARTLADFETSCDRVLAEFTDIALGNLGAAHAETYQGPVLFAPAAFLSVFVSPLVSASSAIAVQRERSALASKLGEEIAIPTLSVHDDPTDVTLAGAGTFDREGQPTGLFELLREGRLQGWLYNGYAAAVDGVTSTGHAAGGARSTPGLGPHAIVVEGTGTSETSALAGELGRGLVVQRFSGTVDPASGDFSGVAKSARWVENGAIVRPVRETMISGNAFELLRRIVGGSREPERCSGSAKAPWALIDGVSVTAG